MPSALTFAAPALPLIHPLTPRSHSTIRPIRGPSSVKTSRRSRSSSAAPSAAPAVAPSAASSVAPYATAQAPSPPPSQLKERSLLTLRGLSDLGCAAVLHELSTRLLLGASMAGAAGAAGAALADAQLLLGSLMGVWTAAAFSERLRLHTNALIAESSDLPRRWDSAIVYRPALDPDDALAAIAWLSSFDEMEGPAAAAMLRSLAEAESGTVRAALADGLAQFPARSNAALSVLNGLAHDREAQVSDAARAALLVYEEAGVVSAGDAASATEGLNGAPPLPPSRMMSEETMAAVLDRLFDECSADSGDAGDLEELQSTPSEPESMLDAVAERVEHMGSMALTSPDLRKFGTLHGEADVDVEAREVPRSVKVDVPLFEGLRKSEVHGLSALALLPAAYEILSVVDGVDLPLRFIGLGWLLTVGGLVAYPQSAALWRRLQKTLDEASVVP